MLIKIGNNKHTAVNQKVISEYHFLSYLELFATESPLAFPNLSYVQTKIFDDEYTKDFAQIINRRRVKSSLIVTIFVPDGRKWARNDVKDWNSSSHERNVIIFNSTSGEIKAEKIGTVGTQ